MNKSEHTVLRVLSHYGPATDKDIVNRATKVYKSKFSASGLRTRRKELVSKGLVKPTTRQVTKPMSWDLTAAGKRVLSKAA